MRLVCSMRYRRQRPFHSTIDALIAHHRIRETLKTSPCTRPYLVKLKVSTLISAFCLGCTKPISRFKIVASISRQTLRGNNGEQYLCRRDHAANRMDRKLLDGPIDRCCQILCTDLLLALCDIIPKPIGLSLCLCQLTEQRAMKLRDRLGRDC